MSKELDNLDKSLLTLNEVGDKFEEMFANKKNEKILMSGATASAKEAQENFNNFLLKSRDELAEEVKKGQIPEAVAKYVLTWLQKSHDTVKKFASDKTAQLNIKIGEIVSLDNSIKVLKLHKDMYELKKLELEKQLSLKSEEEKVKEPPVDPSPPEKEGEVKDASKSKRGRKVRPDEVGPLSKTVQRLKENRKKKTAK